MSATPARKGRRLEFFCGCGSRRTRLASLLALHVAHLIHLARLPLHRIEAVSGDDPLVLAETALARS